jgi:arylsulfatase A-like enzyme
MLTGFVEVILLGVQKFGFQQAIFLGPHVIWMAALADGLLFLLLGLLGLALSQRWQRLRSSRSVISLVFLLALLSWLFIFPQIKWYASVVLATGAALQIGRFLAPRLSRTGLARSTKLCAGMVILLVIGVNGWLWWSEHRAVANLPQAQNNAPNVLLITLDTVRAQSLSLYGYNRKTSPQLERIAARGVKFDRAMATSPWTLPSHASMFTGYYPHELSADFLKPLDTAKPTLAEALQARGYLTAGFVANTYYCGYEHGLARGFLHYEDYRISAVEFLLSSSLLRALTHNATLRQWVGAHEVLTRVSAAEINQHFLSWLPATQERTQRPFFAFLNYFDAHEPYLPPAPYNSLFTDTPCRADGPYVHALRTAWYEKRERLSAAQNRMALDAYESSIAYLDHQLGLLFDELERRQLLNNTLVIITSDHGEAFGEHGHHGHGDSLYLPLLHVPLVMMFPARLPANRTVAVPVTLRDLPATVMELLRLPATPPFPGASLTRCWESGETSASPLLAEVNLAPIQPQNYAPGTKAKLKSLILGRYQYIKNPDGSEELYDILADPSQARKLADNAEKDWIAGMLQRLQIGEQNQVITE